MVIHNPALAALVTSLSGGIIPVTVAAKRITAMIDTAFKYGDNRETHLRVPALGGLYYLLKSIQCFLSNSDIEIFNRILIRTP